MAGGIAIATAVALALQAVLGRNWAALAVSMTVAVAFGLTVAAFLHLIERTRLAREAQAEADLDALTGILNRRALTKGLTRIFADRERSGDDVGVFFIDVDNFKEINDRHGHEFGDRYLRHIAWTIASQVRDADLVGRMGGDEFVAILPAVERGLMRTIAERLVTAAGEPFCSHGATVRGGISIGCHLSPAGEGPTTALDLADDAAYHAKTLGRGRYVEFTSALQKLRERREQITLALSSAVHEGAFDIYYQPVFAVDGGGILSFEALLRLSIGGDKALDPQEVLPIAETSGLIVPLGARILERTTALGASWPEEIRLSVNVSPVQFRAGTVPEIVHDALTISGLAPGRLTLEVKERVVRDGGDRVSGQLAQLHDMGVNVAMDDFGGGDAALGHLWAHQFDQIKVDGVLQEAFAFDPDRYRPLFDIISDLGQRLGMPVTLKGIDSAQGAALARELGCESYQGNWLGRPIPAEATRDLIAQHIDRGQATPGI